MESFLKALDDETRERLLARLVGLRETLWPVHEAARDEEPLTGPELEKREAAP